VENVVLKCFIVADDITVNRLVSAGMQRFAHFQGSVISKGNKNQLKF